MTDLRPRSLSRRVWLLTRLLRPILIASVKLRISRVKVRGRQYVLRSDAFIVACNHTSLSDPVILWGALRRNAALIAMKELWRWPVVGLLVRAMGHIPVDRRDRESGREAIEHGVRVLKAGGIVPLFPEGRISPDGRQLPLKPGVYHLALASRAPVVPAGISGADGVMPPGSSRLRLRHPVELTFGPPLWAHDFTGPDACDQFLAALAQSISRLSGREYAAA